MRKILLIFSVLLLFSLLVPLTGASATKSLVIEVAEDTYVVTDLNDPDDAYGIRGENFGELDFVKAWYLWNVEVQEVPVEEEEASGSEPTEIEDFLLAPMLFPGVGSGGMAGECRYDEDPYGNCL